MTDQLEETPPETSLFERLRTRLIPEGVLADDSAG